MGAKQVLAASIVQIKGLPEIYRADKGAQEGFSGALDPIICTKDILIARYLHEGCLTLVEPHQPARGPSVW
jgi:hypothetical protein